MDPQKGKEKRRRFKGLDHIPVVTSGEKGTTYILKAEEAGSVMVGMPVYYKHLKAGSIASYKLDTKSRQIIMEVFIKKPFDSLVTSKTRFFNASGVYANLSADGIEVQTESLVSVMLGGFAFDNFPEHGRGIPVKKGHVFYLYKDRKEARKVRYKRELFFWVHFNESIRGLSEGAPVEYHGVKIGEVVNFTLIGNPETAEFQIPILIKIEPERFIMDTRNESDEVNTTVFGKLLAKGLRAQLKTGNLLTGELYIDLDFYKNLTPVKPYKENGLYVIPAVPTTMASLKSNLQSLLERIAAIPFEKIGKETHELLVRLRTETIPKLDGSVESVNKLLRDTDKLMNAARTNYFDSNAELNRKLLRLLDEMTRTTKSIKHLTDYLERHPESLIRGK
jgi:paraquat-inducible protein B